MTRNRTIYLTEQTYVEDYDRRMPVRFTFRIESIRYSKDDFTIVEARVLHNDRKLLFPQNTTSVKGQLLNPKVGDTYESIGKVQYDARFGYSIAMTSRASMVYPRTKDEVIKYLDKSMPAVGKKTAKLIVDHLGEDALLILSKEPKRIYEIEALHRKDSVYKSIKNNLLDTDTINQTMALLNAMGIRESYAMDLYERYGSTSYLELESNPYVLTDVEPLLWKTAERFFQQQATINLGVANYKKVTNLEYRYRSAIKYYLKLELEMSGSLAIQLERLIDDFESGRFLNANGVFPDHKNNYVPREHVMKILEDLETELSVVVTKSNGGEAYVYLYPNYMAEKKVVTLIRRFNKNSFAKSLPGQKEAFIELYESRSGFRLAEMQKRAVDLLANNKVSILTGGPGSGKTTTLKAVKEFIDYLVAEKTIKDGSVTLLAPTGKASRRMAEVLDCPAETIHRKLGIKGFGEDAATKTVDEAFVIVDESSMIDIHLFSTLLDSLGEDTNLILVGDKDQLPSVGAGLIFRDLIESGKVPCVRLDKTFRQAGTSKLVSNARLMSEGIGISDDPNALGLQFDTAPGRDSYFIERYRDSEITATLISSVKKLRDKGVPQRDILILTAQNKGKLGTRELNRQIQSVFNEDDGEVAIRKADSTMFRVGDPVIQMVNDYEHDVFNGEIGVVEDIYRDEKGEKIVQVLYEGLHEDNTVLYYGSRIYDIELAYVITIHKSQGSESPYVIQVIDKAHARMNNRSLVFTGYTRTKLMNIMIGQRDTLNAAIANTDNLKRISLIKEKL